MTDPDVLVIGAGPAGLAAATEVRRAGLGVEIVEQRTTVGGAIYRQPIDGVAPLVQKGAAARRWRDLHDEFLAYAVPVSFASVFIGVDGDGKVLVEDRAAGLVRRRLARAVIFAVGAVEEVAPRPGWQLAGVTTAGGLQVMMKETGRAPSGRVLLAGSGPLLIAIAAQMARLGNPPVAIVEAGNPVSKIGAGLSLMAHPGLMMEALGYLGTVLTSGIPWLRGSTLQDVSKDDQGLVATVCDSAGRRTTYHVARIGLHNGIRPNDFGLLAERHAPSPLPMILRAGDCREALGAEAAIADGRRIGRQAVGLISGQSPRETSEIEGFRHAQRVLARLFAATGAGTANLGSLPDDTVLCRCENRTVGDLKRLCGQADALTGREVKHNGRFAMGACQGRFCAANTAALMAALRPQDTGPAPDDLTGQRWPVRPVPIGALIGGGHDRDTSCQDERIT